MAVAFKQQRDALFTKPPPLRELARYFDENGKTMQAIVKIINGAKLVGSLWRIPLREMPPRYHLETGHIPESVTR